MSSIFRIFCIVQLTAAGTATTAAAQLLGGYAFSCSNSEPCDSARNFSCDAIIAKCICAQHPDPDYMFIFDIHAQACVPILAQYRNQFWHCEDESYYRNLNKSDDSDLGFCKSDHECNVAHNSTSLHCNYTRCSCECLPEHPETGLPLETENTKDTCIYQPIWCGNDTECEQEYGSHSLCGQISSSCRCMSRTQFYHGKCVRQRKYDETCVNNLECELGTGKYSTCSSQPGVCKCEDGFRINLDTGQCVAEMVSWPKPRDHQSYQPYKSSRTPLIIVGFGAALCLAGLFTVCWLQRTKTRNYDFRRVGNIQGLELGSSFSCSKDTLDERGQIFS